MLKHFIFPVRLGGVLLSCCALSCTVALPAFAQVGNSGPYPGSYSGSYPSQRPVTPSFNQGQNGLPNAPTDFPNQPQPAISTPSTIPNSTGSNASPAPLTPMQLQTPVLPSNPVGSTQSPNILANPNLSPSVNPDLNSSQGLSTFNNPPDLSQPANMVNPPSSLTLRAALTKTQTFPIDLATVLRLVRQQNLLIAQDKANERIANTQLYENVSNFLPSVMGVYNQSKFVGGTQSFGGNILTVKRVTIQPQLEADWTIYPGGTTLFQTLAARQIHKAAQSQLKETTQEQLANGAIDYYNLLQAYLQEQNARLSLQEAQQQVTLNTARYKAGVGTRIDLVQAQTLQSQQEQALLQAENTRIQAEQTLLNLLNLDYVVGLQPNILESIQHVLVTEGTPVASLVAMADEQSPALQQAKAQVLASRQNYYAAWSGVVPSVTLRTYINKTGSTWSNLQDGRFGGLSATANLFQNMGLAAPLKAHEMRGAIDKSKIAEQITRRNLETQVVSNYIACLSLSKTLQTASDQLNFARDNYRLALGRFKAGVDIYLNVVNSQIALSNARNNYTGALLNYNLAEVKLVSAMGIASLETLTKGVTLPATPATASSATKNTH